MVLSYGLWETSLLLKPGKYQFKFIVDGVWTCDTVRPTCYDHSGNLNNTLEVAADPPLVEEKVGRTSAHGSRSASPVPRLQVQKGTPPTLETPVQTPPMKSPPGPAPGPVPGPPKPALHRQIEAKSFMTTERPDHANPTHAGRNPSPLRPPSQGNSSDNLTSNGTAPGWAPPIVSRKEANPPPKLPPVPPNQSPRSSPEPSPPRDSPKAQDPPNPEDAKDDTIAKLFKVHQQLQIYQKKQSLKHTKPEQHPTPNPVNYSKQLGSFYEDNFDLSTENGDIRKFFDRRNIYVDNSVKEACASHRFVRLCQQKIIVVVLSGEIEEGKVESAKEVWKRMTLSAMKEPGCLFYNWSEFPDGQFVSTQLFVDSGAVIDHFHHTILIFAKELGESCSDLEFRVMGDIPSEEKEIFDTLCQFGSNSVGHSKIRYKLRV
uniref:AMP-activated protein kinase glycogen-binding domain-containing protein n=1 Tax=Arcella intermedia TaxID=1963864 RepID=A0A6B2L3T1_9EUKA